jgi:hypothetical protein
MKNSPNNIGIDPKNPGRCFISVPVDIEYMKEQRSLLLALMDNSPHLIGESESEPRKNMEHLIGFLDHFIFGIYGVVAEYPTANRNIPLFGQD